MDLHIQSFIIKIWLEESADRTGHAVWHGRITHVPSGEQYSLKDLNEILTFIVPYLEGMGVEFGIRWRVRQWLNRMKRYLIGDRTER